jgi:nitrate/TMAO reductase-like tetraheme cytochrome c subunit
MALASLIAIVTGAVALALLLTIYFLPLQPGPGRRWLLLFGVAVLPCIALLLGTGEALEQAKKPSFCGSCHVMQPWMRDLRDLESETLAAVHYKNRWILKDQCYTCHTGYAFFGPMEAKLNGVIHFLRYETGTYTRPLEPYSPYDFANCLRCHGEAKNFRVAHEAVAEELASGAMGCLDCHGPVHPAQEDG